MRALTLWQPWASAITQGPKRIENRPWKPPADLLGQRFLIHAGKKWNENGAAFCKRLGFHALGPDLPFGALIGSAFLSGFMVLNDAGAVIERDHAGRPDWPKLTSDPWFFGPVGWILSDVVALEEPIPCRGYQKLWRPSHDILRKL